MLIPKTARDRLTQASEQLARYLIGSEQVFLQTADRLQGLAKRANGILNSSNDAVTFSTGETNPLERLTQALHSMEANLDVSREAASAGASCLGEVWRKVQQLVDTGAEFQRIASTLRSLSTSLRIEDGRRAEGFGFSSVSADVVRLSRLITAKFDAILTRANNLNDTVRFAKKREHDFLKAQGAHASDLLGKTRASLNYMADLQAAGGVLRRKSIEASHKIRTEVTQILVALQVHDITRQMLEHAIESMRAFAAELSGEAVEYPPGDEKQTDHLVDLSALCRIQSLQVAKARCDLVSALHGIAKTLRDMSTRVGHIVESAQQVTARDGAGSLLTDVEHGVGEAADILHRQLQHEQETFAAVEAVAVSTAAMESFIGDIAIIANDVKVVALNALVKAIKTGSRGAVFAALAQAIKDLSLEVASKTEMVAQVMREMTQLATNLGKHTHNSKDSEQIENLLTHLTADLRRYHNALLSNLTTLRRDSSDLAVEVEDIARSLLHQAQLTEGLHQVERDLATMGKEAAKEAGPGPRHRSSRWLDETAERYTMESERTIHHSVDAGWKEPTAAVTTPASSNDLGSNVELF